MDCSASDSKKVDCQNCPDPDFDYSCSVESVVEAHDCLLDVVDSPYLKVIVDFELRIDSAVVVAHFEARLVREIVTVVVGVDLGVDFDREIVDFAIETDQVESDHASVACHPGPGGEFAHLDAPVVVRVLY